MVLRVRPTPTRFPTNAIGQYILAFFTKCMMPEGLFIVIAEALVSANIKGQWYEPSGMEKDIERCSVKSHRAWGISAATVRLSAVPLYIGT